MSKHTPTPWEARECLVYMGNEGGFSLKHCPTPEANAKHIVKCVNEHEALKAENERLRSTISTLNGLEIHMTMSFKFYKDAIAKKDCDEEIKRLDNFHDAGKEHQLICEQVLENEVA